MAKNPPDGYQRAHAYLVYEDAPAALEFLTKAFGFEETFRLTMDDGRIGHADLSYEGVVVASLASLWREMGFESPRHLGGVHSQVNVYVDDVDAHHEQARAAGANIAAPPADQDYGARIYRVVDPEGHRWIFAQHVRDVSHEEHTSS